MTEFQKGLMGYLESQRSYYKEKVPSTEEPTEIIVIDRITDFCKINGNPNVWKKSNKNGNRKTRMPPRYGKRRNAKKRT